MNQTIRVVLGGVLLLVLGGYIGYFYSNDNAQPLPNEMMPEEKTMPLETDDMSGQEEVEKPEVSAEVGTLSSYSWQWQSAVNGEGVAVEVVSPEDFVITFDTAGRFSATTDCNSLGGSYAVNGAALLFGTMISTKMYCEGSQEAEFAALLSETTAYTLEGEMLVLNLSDEGSMTFAPVVNE